MQRINPGKSLTRVREDQMKTAAIVLAGGSGSRMKTKTKKQYLVIGDKPVLWYSLNVLNESDEIDEIVLVCGKGETETCRAEYVEKYGFEKVKIVTEGGKERYHSVHAGLQVLEECDYILIHDGARPFLDEAMLKRIKEALKENSACVVGMPVKDTMKIAEDDGYVAETLPRDRIWSIQTPQAFSYPLIRNAYDTLIQREQEGKLDVKITDDAMVAEYVYGTKVKLVEGSYSNIKITTQDDLLYAEAIVRKMYEK